MAKHGARRPELARTAKRRAPPCRKPRGPSADQRLGSRKCAMAKLDEVERRYATARDDPAAATSVRPPQTPNPLIPLSLNPYPCGSCTPRPFC